MANNICDWCNKSPGSSWPKTINGQKYESEEKFCSLKCKSQYEDNYSITWIKPSNSNIGCIVIVVILIIIFLANIIKNG